MKWEYKVIDNQAVSGSTSEELKKRGSESLIESTLTKNKLNQLGNDGWELISYYDGSVAGKPVAIFKRPKN